MKKKDARKEAAIIEQTLEIVNETGLAGVKMSVLAKRVGLSPSTLYVYFSSKEELIQAVSSRIFKDMATRHESSLKGLKSYKLKFRAKWLNLVDFHLNYERELNFLQQFKKSPYYNNTPSEALQHKMKVSTAFFDEGKTSMKLKNLSNKVFMTILTGMARETAHLIKTGQISKSESDMDDLFNVAWDALSK